jgi:Lecithin:cholesterol acyltransferase
MTDVVIVVPGVMGSTLVRNGKPVWSPTLGGLIELIRHFAGNITDLTLPDGIGDQHPDDGVEAIGLMPDVHALPGIWTPIKGYDRLVTRIEGLGYHRQGNHPDAPPGNLILFPYDWRLSNRYTARRLAQVANRAHDRWRARGGPHADAKLIFVAHSMGGLIARRYVECEQGAERTRKIITLGTPYRGAARAIEQLVNGVRPGLGPLSINLTEFARSLPSLHQLLPEYACIDDGGRGELLRTTDLALPELGTGMVTDAMAFHHEINQAAAARPASNHGLHIIIGARQPTATTVRIAGHRAEILETYRDGSHVDNDYGDATVPRTGGVPHGLPLDTPLLHHIVDQHGNLHHNKAALDEVEQAITAKPVHRKALPTHPIRARIPDLILHGEPLTIDIDVESDTRHALRVTTTAEDGRTIDARGPLLHSGHASTPISHLDPGAYTIQISSLGGELAPITSTVLVWPAEAL